VKVGAGGGGTIGGSGTINRVPKFTAGTTIGNSQIFDDGTGVGIGTTSPVTDLQISRAGSSTFRLTNTSNSTNVELGIATALGFVGTNTDNSFAINTNNAERVRITNTGNVGIGTTSPGNRFVVSNSGASGLEVNPTGGVSSGVLLQAYNRNTSAYMAQSYYALTHTWNTGTTGATRAMDIASGGAVLINTTTDNGVDKLQVNGSMNVSAKATAQTLSVTSNATVGGALNVTGSTLASSFEGSALGIRTVISFNASPAAGITGTISNHDYYLQSNATTRAVITATGRILANTTTDNGVDELQVNGSISGIGFKQAYVTKTGAYTATNDDYVIDCTSGTFTVTLPASSGRTGRILIIKNSGAGTITVDGNGAETIDGAATYAISVQYGTIQIMSDGTNWKIIAKF
jgi:hypothetical protein